MRKLYISFLLIISASVYTFGGVTQITVDGIAREYIVVAPETSSDSPKPLIVFLHGLGWDITEYEAMAQQLANEKDAVVLLPQALNEQDDNLIGLANFATSYALEIPEILTYLDLAGIQKQDLLELSDFSAYPVWGAGASIPFDFNDLVSRGLIPNEPLLLLYLQSTYKKYIDAGKIELNKDVDDVAFINSAINDIKVPYNIDESKILVAGASMGGAMAYKYAYSENSQATALAVVSGFIGNEVDHSKTLDIPVCIFHSKDDEIIPYEGTVFSQPITEIISEFAQKFGCGEAITDDIKKIADDGITVQVNNYECNTAFKFYLLSGASHFDFLTSDYETGPNDIDYFTEIWNFFAKSTSLNVEDISVSNNISFFYPNPAKENISFSVSGNYELKDIAGKAVLKGNAAAGESISVGNIPAGLYVITLKSAEGNCANKLIIK